MRLHIKNQLYQMGNQNESKKMKEPYSCQSESSGDQETIPKLRSLRHQYSGETQVTQTPPIMQARKEKSWSEDFIDDDEYIIKRKKLRKSILFSNYGKSTQEDENESDQFELLTMEQIENKFINPSELEKSPETRQLALQQYICSHSKQITCSLKEPKQSKQKEYGEQPIEELEPNNKFFLKRIIHQDGIEIVLQFVNEEIFVKLDQLVVEISKQTKYFMDDYYLKKSIIIPLISPNISQQIYAQSYWKLLLAYLVQYNQQLFRQSIISISKNKERGKLSHKKSQDSWMDLSSYFPIKHYSKAELLKTHTLKKFSFLSKFHKQDKSDLRKQVIEQLAHLQMVLSFERAINHCKIKQKQASQACEVQKWKQCDTQINNQMKKWISEHNIGIRC